MWRHFSIKVLLAEKTKWKPLKILIKGSKGGSQPGEPRKHFLSFLINARGGTCQAGPWRLRGSHFSQGLPRDVSARSWVWRWLSNHRITPRTGEQARPRLPWAHRGPLPSLKQLKNYVLLLFWYHYKYNTGWVTLSDHKRNENNFTDPSSIVGPRRFAWRTLRPRPRPARTPCARCAGDAAQRKEWLHPTSALTWVKTFKKHCFTS